MTGWENDVGFEDVDIGGVYYYDDYDDAGGGGGGWAGLVTLHE
jgi:hypothetical protein